jgi:hypothetical protein
MRRQGKDEISVKTKVKPVMWYEVLRYNGRIFTNTVNE